MQASQTVSSSSRSVVPSRRSHDRSSNLDLRLQILRDFWNSANSVFPRAFALTLGEQFVSAIARNFPILSHATAMVDFISSLVRQVVPRLVYVPRLSTAKRPFKGNLHLFTLDHRRGHGSNEKRCSSWRFVQSKEVKFDLSHGRDGGWEIESRAFGTRRAASCERGERANTSCSLCVEQRSYESRGTRPSYHYVR